MNRTIAPEFKGIDHINLIKPDHLKLENGCNVFSFNSGDQDLVRIEWIFSNLRFDPSKPLANVAVNTMLTEGTATRSASQIADQIDFYGAFLQVDYGYDNSQVTLYTLNKHLQHTLTVIKDMLMASVFPENELKTYVRNQQQKLQVNLQKNDIIARRQFNKAVFGDTAYGFGADAKNYQSIQRDDLLAHFKAQYQPQNCTMLVAGKIEEDTLKQITEIFGDWHNNDSIIDTTQPAIHPSAERFFFTEKPGALQSAIRLGRPAVNRTHPDFPALQVLNTVLGGYFGSRLMANIREDKGYTYGIGAGASPLKYGASIFIASEVGADVCRDAVNEVKKEVDLLSSDLIPEDELQLVRNYMLGSLLGSLENVFSHADKFKNIYFFGLGYDYYDRYTQTIKTITAEELQQMAGKYYQFEDFYKVVVGKY